MVYIGNRNGDWRWFRGTVGYFVQAGTIINGYGRDSQIFLTQ